MRLSWGLSLGVQSQWGPFPVASVLVRNSPQPNTHRQINTTRDSNLGSLLRCERGIHVVTKTAEAADIRRAKHCKRKLVYLSEQGPPPNI